MGFYGNITNSAKTNMTFDKKYSSRYEMDKNVESDGVYAGRYVLVEYGLSWSTAVYSSDENDNNSDENILYYKWGNNLYKDSAYTQKIILNPEEIEIFFVVEYKTDSVKRSRSELWVNYKTGRLEQVIDKISDDSADSNYVANFNIDKKIYGDGRGYDSTVWTKVFDKNGKPQYVMIAELNSVVPTFSLSVHAPDNPPMTPYFSEVGSNVHYDLHVSTPWGVEFGELKFNEAGFNSEVPSKIEGANKIDVVDISKNTNEYVEGSNANDTKQININLPGIGNMMSDAFDIIYGSDRKSNPSNSLQGKLNAFQNLQSNEIPVQSQNGYLVGATIGGDDWISCVVDSTKTEEDKIKITHKDSKQVSTTVGNDATSLNFGSAFNIAKFTTDATGHIIDASNQKITLPIGSYDAADNISESTEVITSIDLEETSGKITSKKADSSTLKLASYSAGTDTTDVADGDTYNNAFAKLQNQINGLDYGESSTTQIITAINQVDGLINVTRGDAGTLLLTGYELKENEGSDADLLATDNLKTAFSKLQRQIHVEEATRAATINALDVPEITTESYEVISAVSETNGKISANKKKAGTLTLADYLKPSSGSAISSSDSLNNALGKLEYKLDTEIDRVDNLNYSDIESTTTKVITKVTQDNGKVNVIHTNVGDLLRVIGHDDNNNEITTTIDDSFANLQTQINNIIGSGDIADNFNTIKEIADWLKANDSDANGIIDSIATLNGDEETSGSIQNQIKTAIENLDSEKVASAGKYISGIHIVDGKISTIDEIELPTYVSNVQADWNATEGAATILNKPINLITTDSEFLYSSNEITDDTTGNVEVVEVKYTIEELMTKIFELENRIKDLEAFQEESTT